jgi:hypothetical protein
MNQWYTPHPAPADVRDVLVCTWPATTTGTHRLTPDACVDVLRTSLGHVLLCGPERTSWTFRLPPGTTAVGARFRPGAVHDVWGIDVSTIADRVVPLGDVVPHAAGAVRKDGDFVATIVDTFATRRSVDPVLDLLAVEPRANAARLAAAVGRSVRAAHRRAVRRYGYGVATLARLLRFQRWLAVVSADSSMSFARSAAAAGYTDQAHLHRECRAITSLTPAGYIAEHFPTFPDMADPYKTPGGLLDTIDP